MKVHSAEQPVTADQVTAALAALGRAAVPHPRRRPDSRADGEVLDLLGALLAVTELEAACRTEPAALPPVGLPALQHGWHAQTGTTDLRRVVLVNRLRRSGADLSLLPTAPLPHGDPMDPEPSVDDPPGVYGAQMCALAAANLAVAQHQADQHHRNAAHATLDATQGMLAQALLAVNELRCRLDGRDGGAAY
ncbi:hypothetical protein ABT160_12260 [Streptomyces sp. NPDC001941]|uniref:hypothetical protein n=1 Tax=Streptomyces sp. NPDC001941 TaxID=3154659 RepID=UPI00332E72A2